MLRLAAAGCAVGLFLISPLLPLHLLSAAPALAGSGQWVRIPPFGAGFSTVLILSLGLSVLGRVRPAGMTRGQLTSNPLPLHFLAALCLAFAVSLLWTPSVNYGLDKLYRLSLLTCYAALVVVALRKRFVSHERIYDSIRWGALAIVAVGLFEASLSGWAGVLRLSVGGNDPITFGGVAGAGLLMTLREVTKTSEMTAKFRKSAATVLLVAGMVGSNSKGPIVALALALLIASPGIRRKVRLLGVAALLGFVVLSVLPETVTYRLDPSLYVSDPGGARSASLVERQRLWSAASYAFLDNPVTGAGAGGFNAVPAAASPPRTDDDAASLYPHNIVLEAAAELGFTGLIMLGGAVYASYRNVRQDRTRKMLLVYGTVLSLFSGDLGDVRWLALAVALASVSLPTQMLPSERFALFRIGGSRQEGGHN